MNTFDCSVKSYSEVSSKNYIFSLATNAFVFYLEVGLETPKKNWKLREKLPEKKISFQVGMDLYKGQRQGRDEKTQEHYYTT